MPKSSDEDTVTMRWRGEDTVSVPWLGVVLATGDTVEVPASLVNLDGDPAAPGFFFPTEVWSYAGDEPRKKKSTAAATEVAVDSPEAPKVGE